MRKHLLQAHCITATNMSLACDLSTLKYKLSIVHLESKFVPSSHSGQSFVFCCKVVTYSYPNMSLGTICHYDPGVTAPILITETLVLMMET